MTCVDETFDVVDGTNVGLDVVFEESGQKGQVVLGLIGPGRVGRELLEQVRRSGERSNHRSVQFGVYGIASRHAMQLCGHNMMDSASCESVPADLDRFVSHLIGVTNGPVVVVDCTASDDVADRYAEWLARGVHVVTPNKLAGSGCLERWRLIQRARSSGGQFKYEATVGAGLPVINTLRDLIDTGDELVSFDGMLSGTISWLLNCYDGSLPFSDLVRKAHVCGLTEPNPADDLSGMDVARKLVILAREAGIELSLDDVEVSPVVEMPGRRLDPVNYFAHLSAHDCRMVARLESARERGKVLRYVASLNAHGRASVRLDEMDVDHPFSRTGLTDNVVRFTTGRYDKNPLHVQGPGAGAEVTAAAVFADILRVVREVGC